MYLWRYFINKNENKFTNYPKGQNVPSIILSFLFSFFAKCFLLSLSIFLYEFNYLFSLFGKKILIFFIYPLITYATIHLKLYIFNKTSSRVSHLVICGSRRMSHECLNSRRRVKISC